MINLEIKDKYELQALHKALMESKFNPEPLDPVVQSSPMVARVMNLVVDELEKINWVTDAERKLRGLEFKNGWAEWRTNPPEEKIVSIFKRNITCILELENESAEKLYEYLSILVSPYSLDKPECTRLLDLAKSA